MNWKAVQAWLVTVLLFCLLVVEGYQVFRDVEAQKQCKAAFDSQLIQITAQKGIYLDLLQMYQKSAYGNNSIDRIAEQQLIAAESQITALQVMAAQNNTLIELESACR